MGLVGNDSQQQNSLNFNCEFGTCHSDAHGNLQRGNMSEGDGYGLPAKLVNTHTEGAQYSLVDIAVT